jgi:hypothetical protein
MTAGAVRGTGRRKERSMCVNELEKRLKRLENRKPKGVPPLVVRKFLSTEERERLTREAIEEYELPPLFVVLKRQPADTINGG